MKCPHCNVGIHAAFARQEISYEGYLPQQQGEQPRMRYGGVFYHMRCPECRQSIVLLELIVNNATAQSFTAYPQSATRPIPPEAIDPYRQDFAEVCKVLADSPKASAALSRRTLQALLKDQLGA